MKKMLRLSFLAFLLVLQCQLYCAVKSPEVALEVARNFYLSVFDSNVTADNNQILITLAATRKSGNNDLFYIYNVNASGFVIISACDATIPVLGFSSEGFYDAQYESEIPAFAELLKGYEAEIKGVIEMDLPATPEIILQWEKWQRPVSSTDNGRSVSPLLSTTWNQSCHYNELCPEDNDAPYGYCNHVPAGCVALAMAQVMKYWDYPSTGTGYHEYYISPYGWQSADFENTTYQWDNMPNSIGSSNIDLATLIYHCAVSVNMQFGPNGSGASTSMAHNSMVNYFNYSEEAQYLYKNSFSNPEWETMLRDNLDTGRPVIYRGDGTGGHAWVCDGYAADNYFHMNWGWGGYENGYFYLSNLNPAGANFTGNQAAIMGIVPAEANVEPPVGLQAQVSGSDVLLSWSAPVEPQWIHWDNETNCGSITLSDGGSFYAAARWASSDLEPYDGLLISKVSVFLDSGLPEYVLKIWKGENAANLVYTQGLGAINENSWNTVDLISPASKGLIGYNVYRDAQKINEDYVQGTSFLDEDLPAGTYQYYVTSVYYAGESEPSNYVTVSVGVLSHNFILTEGWNSISSNLIPVNSEIEIICNPLINHLIIMQDLTDYYYPANNVNTLQNWDFTTGYFIKVDQDCELPFQGFTNEINTLTLNNGWNLMPVLSACDVNTETLFSGIVNYIRIVKDATGTGVYWPSKGINTLPALKPGKAYYVKIFSTKTITFPECE